MSTFKTGNTLLAAGCLVATAAAVAVAGNCSVVPGHSAGKTQTSCNSRAQEKQAVLRTITAYLKQATPEHVAVSRFNLTDLDIQSEWALAGIKPLNQSQLDPATILLHKQGGRWKVLTLGTNLHGAGAQFHVPGRLWTKWGLEDAPVQDAQNYSVVPGHSVGKIWLGAPRTAVIKAMGKPSEIARLRNGLMQDSWLGPKPPSDNQERRIVHVLYRRNRAIQIELNSPSFVTANGVSMRTSLGELHRKFKNLRPSVRSYAERGYVRYYYDDVQRGITFQAGGNDLSWNLKEDPRRTPESIIVHRRGYRVIPEAGGRLEPKEEAVMAPQRQISQGKMGHRVYSSYFESNQSGLKGSASYLAFTNRRDFDRVFGSAATMGKNSFLPDNAFASKLVVTVIKRGNSMWNYKVRQVTATDGRLYIRYGAKATSGAAAAFASPLILAVDKKPYRSIVFIENGRQVGTVRGN